MSTLRLAHVGRTGFALGRLRLAHVGRTGFALGRLRLAHFGRTGFALCRRGLGFAFVLVTGCDYSGDFLFAQPVEGLDDIFVLTAENGDLLVPATVTTIDEIRAATIYAEVGAPQTTSGGGVTIDFLGTGGPVCIWMDPETVTWNQSVAAQPESEIAAKFTYPDNIFDDGDLDVLAGRSVYYTGSPGETIGDFKVSYEDSLGNEIPIDLVSCPNTFDVFDGLATAGRAFPEYCEIAITDPGVSYTALLEIFAAPLDDDRLSFGVILANGTCVGPNSLESVAFGGLAASDLADECLIQGESLRPEPSEFGPHYGFDAAAHRIWADSIDFESQFCLEPASTDPQMRIFCNNEADLVAASGAPCGWEDFDASDPEQSRCYCGDLRDTPDGGAF